MAEVEQNISDADGLMESLLVGDASGAFEDRSQISASNIQQCDTMLDAISLAEEGAFATLYVVMSSFDNGLELSLKAFRRINPDLRIILLAKMYEEARARKMIRSLKDTDNPADDYIICPVDIKSLNAKAGLSKTSQAIPLNISSLIAYKDARIRELEKLATEDDLTNLKNRRYVREFLRQITDRARKENVRVTLLVFDIDDFKHYNDEYGHSVGDNVLKQAAIMMRRCCRSHDVTARIGGDEFAFIFWDCPGEREKRSSAKSSDIKESDRRSTEVELPNEAVFMAERFRKEISSEELSFLGSEGKGVLTVSGGLASFPKDGQSVEELFEKADKALLEAKRSGKNRIYLVGQ